jgi:ribose-phosphate pyrophosphokinase
MSRLLEPTEAPTSVKSVTATYEKRLMLTAGRASKELGGRIAEKLAVEPIDAGLKTFPDGEVYCRYQESIRGADIFIVQSICGSESGVSPSTTRSSSSCS